MWADEICSGFRPPYLNMQQALFWDGTFEENWIGSQAAELFKDRIYDPFIGVKKDLVVFDIGANIGLFTLYIRERAKMIYAMEPCSYHFDCLSKMVEFNQLKNVTLIKKAISNYNKKSTLYFHPNKTTNSLYSIDNNNIKGTEEVECISLDKVFEEYKIDHVDFMKFDAEGIESEVFGGEGFAKVADKIDMIVFEMHNWMDRNEHQVLDSLKTRGFKVMRIPNEASLWIATRK
jgi:FkbM family methyltransferase